MDMEDRLSGIGTGIHHHPIPTLRDALIPGQFFCHEKHLPHNLGFVFGKITHRGDMLSGDDENMGGSLGMDIPECHRLGGDSDDVGRDLSLGDSAEETTCIGQGVPLSHIGAALEDGLCRSWPGAIGGAIPRRDRRHILRPHRPWACPGAG